MLYALFLSFSPPLRRANPLPPRRLVNMPAPDAWVSLVNLVNKSYLKSFYSEDTEEVSSFLLFRPFARC